MRGTIIRALGREFWWLCGLAVLVSLTRSMLDPLTPLLAHDLGSPPAVIGALVASGFALPLVLAIPMGHLLDRIGPRPYIACGAFFVTAGPAVVALAPALTSLLVSQVVVGFAQLSFVLATQTLIGGLATGRSEQRFAWYATCVSAGQFAGPLLAGVVADASSLGTAFAFAAGVGLLVVAGSLVVPVAHRPSGHPPAGRMVRPGDLARIATPRFAIAIGLSFVVLFSIGAFTSLLPVYLEGLAYSATTIGVLMSLRPLTAMAIRPALPLLVRRDGGRSIVIGAIVGIVASGMGFLALGSTVVAFASASVLLGAGMALSQPLSMAMTTDAVQLHRLGLAVGMRLTSNRLAQVVSPLMFGGLAQVTSFGRAFGLGAIGAAILGTFVVLANARTTSRPTALANPADVADP